MDTPIVIRAFNLGLKAVANFHTTLSVEQIEYYEKNLDQIPLAIARGFNIEPPLDFIVKVDRSVKILYPDWMKKLMHHKLENTGPVEYDLSKQVELWLHKDQKNHVVSGNIIYDFLKTNKLLENCLNLQDGLAIQQKGIKVFCKLFQEKAVFLWKSVVRNQHSDILVPYLIKISDNVVLHWRLLDNRWDSNNPAFRFRK